MSISLLITVTEQEIKQGLGLSTSPDKQVLCFKRKINDIQQHICKDNFKLFVDVQQEGNVLTIDKEAKVLNDILHKEIQSKLAATNIKEYSIEWKDTFIDDCLCEQHVTYLNQLCEDFVSDMKRLIPCSNDITNIDRDIDKCYQEALHHATFAKRKSEHYRGRSNEIQAIKEYLTKSIDESNHSPLIVTGKSGNGKRALMAHIAYQIPKWFGKEYVLILRFLGTSPLSSEIMDVGKSILAQLCFSLNYKRPDNTDDIRTAGDLRRHLLQLLDIISQAEHTSPVIIILDSVDQLDDQHGVFNMTWLPMWLPRNVYMIVSMLSDMYNCLENIKKRILGAPNKFIDIKPLSDKSADEIIQTYLCIHKRTLTPAQMCLVKESFLKRRQPLLLKLVLEEAKVWTSYLPLSEITVFTSTSHAIKHLFSNLEVKYGKVFVHHALGYLTCSPGGLSNVEMEDVLSCDNSVLSEVYQYHDPPLEGIIRIPSLMWSRLQYVLRKYLITRQMHGKTVVTWYHRQFKDSAEEVFLSSSKQKKYLHNTLADLFIQENGICKTITLQHRECRTMVSIDRDVLPQHLISKNQRKLHILPYHLYHSGRIGELMSYCLGNFKWLQTKLEAQEPSVILKEYKAWISLETFQCDRDVILMTRFFTVCKMLLCENPLSLAYHLVYKLTIYKHTSLMLGQLVSDAAKWLTETDASVILPVDPLNEHSIDIPITGEFCLGRYVVLCNDDKILIGLSTKDHGGKSELVFYLTHTTEMLECISLKYVHALCVDRAKKKILVSNQQGLKVFETRSGDVLFECKALVERYPNLCADSLALSTTGTFCAVYSYDDEYYGKLDYQNKYVHIVDLENDKVAFIKVQNVAISPLAMYFVNNDTWLAICNSACYCLYSVKDVDLISCIPVMGGIAHPQFYQLKPNTDNLIGIATCKEKVILTDFDCASLKYKVLYEVTSIHKITPFGLDCNFSVEVFVLGVHCACVEEPQHIWLYVWNTSTKCTSIEIQSSNAKVACSVVLAPTCCEAFVGWDNGDITVIDVRQQVEIACVSLSEQQLSMLIVNAKLNELYTAFVGTEVTTWNIDALIEMANEKRHKDCLAECVFDNDAAYGCRKVKCINNNLTDRITTISNTNAS